MNPKVADMASKVGFDAADYTWFDFSELGDHADEELKTSASPNRIASAHLSVTRYSGFTPILPATIFPTATNTPAP